MKVNILLLTLLTATPVFATGNETRGGGDVLNCTRSTDNELEGTYALDFVLTYQNESTNPENFLVDVDSWQASHERIGSILSHKLPHFYLRFKHFIDHMDNFTDYSKDRIWKESPFDEKLIDIKDEDFLFNLPQNCYREVDDEINIIQAIIYERNNETNFVTYLYHDSVYQDLLANWPLQFSFLMMHEWLWDYFPPENINRMRDMVRLLHSQALELLSPQRLWRSFRNLGVPLEALGPQPGPNPAEGQSIVRVNWGRSCLQHEGEINCWGGSRLYTSDITDPKDFALLPGYDSYIVAVTKEPAVATDYVAIRPSRPIPEPITVVSQRGRKSRSGYLCHLTKFNGIQCWNSSWEGTVHRLNVHNPTSIRLGSDYYCSTGLHGFTCEAMSGATDMTFLETWEELPLDDLGDYSLGYRYGCFINNGQLACYREGEKDLEAPTFVSAQEVKVGRNHACAIGDRMVKCWSWLEDAEDARLLTQMPIISQPKSIDVSKNHSCVLDEIGVQCWGRPGRYLDVPTSFYPLQP